MSDYQDFLAHKARKADLRGLKQVPLLREHLFAFQAHCVAHALRAGCAGIFLDTGLGKTELQLEWCQHALEASNGKALILTPLAVAQQTRKRAEKWGYEARVIRDQSQAGPGINICNYDRLDRIRPEAFGAVSLDEASILKSFVGKTTRALIDAFRGCRFKLVATATPAPNDHMELGNYAEYLEIMAANEMLSRWFINDTSTASQEWRLKGHAETDFWNWMASWSRMAERPSDLGDIANDARFILPPMQLRQHKAAESDLSQFTDGLFADIQLSATTLHDVKRQTSIARAETVAAICEKEPDETRILWCDTDYEADALRSTVPDAIEIRGSMSIDEKEERLAAFETGQIKFLIAKPSMCGHGLDWSHCARMAFIGRGFSYEVWYQAVRRCWRFGQKRNVVVDLVVAEGEDAIGRVIDRKADDHKEMKAAMREAMKRAAEQSAEVKIEYNPQHMGRMPTWLRKSAA